MAVVELVSRAEIGDKGRDDGIEHETDAGLQTIRGAIDETGRGRDQSKTVIAIIKMHVLEEGGGIA